MSAHLVILTGASGSGKTTLARAAESRLHATGKLCCFDSVGVPSPATMATFSDGARPANEAWQHAMTLQWMDRIAHDLHAGTSVLFEGQMRLAFLHEALAHARIRRARIILVDCDNSTRIHRLTHHRGQPELAGEDMLGWASFLRNEAREHTGKSTHGTTCEVLDTTTTDFTACVDHILRAFTP